MNFKCNQFISNGFECRTIHPFPNPAWEDVSTMVMDTYQASSNTDIYFGMNSKHTNFPKVKQNKIRKNIVYQLEQMDPAVPWANPTYFDRLKTFDEVWDYDKGNIDFLATQNITARYKPLQFSQSLKKASPHIFMDIDALFIGAMNPHRKTILDSIQAKGINLLVTSNIWDSNVLYGFYARSKIILNIHYYPCNIQEQCRIFPMIINGKCVVSEPSRENHFGNYIVETHPEKMADTVQELLTNDGWKAYNSISNSFRKTSYYLND